MYFTNKNDGTNLRNYYPIFMEIGLIGALSLMLIAANMKLSFSGSELNLPAMTQETVTMKEIMRTKQDPKPPPPPRPQPPVAVPNDAVIEDEDIDFSSELDINDPLPLPALPEPPAVEKQEEEEYERIFVAVEQNPELIGGLEQLQKKVKYPDRCRRAGIEGRVVIQFVVDEQGMPSNITILRGIGGGCDEAAVAAVRDYARFKPGKQRGVAVKVQMSIPILFRLS